MPQVSQLWTSYSGYYREVKTMCLAARYVVEHDELRDLRRNLSRSHADQIALLREHRQELLYAHQLQTESLKELSNLQSTVASEMSTILATASTLRDSLSSIYDDISRLAKHSEQGAAQQSIALSNAQEMHDHLLAHYQAVMQETVGSISQSMIQWHHSLQARLSRAQELDRHGEEFMFQIMDSKEHLSQAISQIYQIEKSLRELATAAMEGTTRLLDLHDSGYSKMNVSLQTTTTNMLHSIKSMESISQTAWHSVIESILDGTSRFQGEISARMTETISDIENITSKSQRRLMQLSSLVEELESKQERVLRHLKTLNRGWNVFRGFVRVETSAITMVMPFVIFVVMAVFNSIRTTAMLLFMSTLVTISYNRFFPPVSFGHILLAIVSIKIVKSALHCRSWVCPPVKDHHDMDQVRSVAKRTELASADTVQDINDEWTYIDYETEEDIPPRYYLFGYMDDDNFAYPSSSLSLGMSLGCCTHSCSS
ncbi:hypothetical protein BGX28_005972 [Mortierella sp. GBA30]|nr:hypothetical protein BGX28_005972 [Mortierella sp. GBA30]